MPITFDHSNNGLAIALFNAYHKKYSKFVFYTDGPRVDELSDEDRAELMKFQHGSDARYKSNWDKLPLDNKLSIIRSPAKGTFVPFFPMNQENERNIHYIFGRSGSGKSYLAKQLSQFYSKMKTNVYLVTPIPDDDYAGKNLPLASLVEINSASNYEKQKKKYEKARIKLKYAKRGGELDDDVLMAMELAVLDLKPVKGKSTNLYKTTDKYKKLLEKGPSLFIYDDTEAISDQPALDYLRTQQLLTGRHHHISMIIINHMSNSGNRTRNIINESNQFTFFRPFNRYTHYFLKEYLQFNGKQIAQAKSMLKSSRYVSVYKNESILLAQNKMLSY